MLTPAIKLKCQETAQDATTQVKIKIKIKIRVIIVSVQCGLQIEHLAPDLLELSRLLPVEKIEALDKLLDSGSTNEDEWLSVLAP